MFKQILSKIFSSRVFYVLFALLVSIALWMYVEITEHDEQRVTVPNIQIVPKNYDVLRDRGFLISSMDPQSVTIDFVAPRSISTALLRPNAVTVEIDLGNITKTGLTNLTYDIVYPPGVNRSSITAGARSVSRISIIVDRLWRVSVPVVVDYRGGTASEDLRAEAEEYDPRMITVEGPEEILSLISYAYVPIPRENLSSSITEDFGFILRDVNDEELEETQLEKLTFSQDTIRVTIPIRQIKDIPLFVEFAHSAGSTDSNTNATPDPQFIKVSGDPEVLKDIHSIFLGTIDTSKFMRSDTWAFPILTPPNVTSISGESEARVLVETTGLGIKYLIADNLQVINTPPGHTPTIVTQSLDVRIRGREVDLELVSAENIRVVADIKDMNPGTSYIPARVYVDGVNADVGAVGMDYRITVTLLREQP